MYAVVETGGHQYRVRPGDTIEVEKLPGDVGDTITLRQVLLLGSGVDVTIGTPQVPDARVEARIVAQKRGKKLIIFKHKRRKGYRRKQGHRQSLTSLQITAIHPEAMAAAPVSAATEVAPTAEVEAVAPVSAETQI